MPESNSSHSAVSEQCTFLGGQTQTDTCRQLIPRQHSVVRTKFVMQQNRYDLRNLRGAIIKAHPHFNCIVALYRPLLFCRL